MVSDFRSRIAVEAGVGGAASSALGNGKFGGLADKRRVPVAELKHESGDEGAVFFAGEAVGVEEEEVGDSRSHGLGSAPSSRKVWSSVP